jgi:hypothetical protein
LEDAEITTWEKFQCIVSGFPPALMTESTTKPQLEQWIFRGIHKHKNLKSPLERACERADIELKNAPVIERLLIREFRRVYDGPDSDKAQKDTLYCMGLMRHYGAPTRLLDWTYSPYVALFFAIKDSDPCECKQHVAYLWALNSTECRAVARQAAPDKTTEIDRRFRDEGVKSNASFSSLYLCEPYYPFVLPENPWHFHERHKVQQGIFLCPGDISVPFDRNLEPLTDRDKRAGQDRPALRQHRICMSGYERNRALDHLHRANVSEASLFPGLGGLACSFWQRMPFFWWQHKLISESSE